MIKMLLLFALQLWHVACLEIIESEHELVGNSALLSIHGRDFPLHQKLRFSFEPPYLFFTIQVIKNYIITIISASYYMFIVIICVVITIIVNITTVV